MRITLHTGQVIDDSEILGIDFGRYPRKNDKDEPTEGNGVYVLQGEELEHYIRLRAEYERDASKRERDRINAEIKNVRRRLLGTCEEQLQFLAVHGLDMFRSWYLRIHHAHPIPFPDNQEDTTKNEDNNINDIINLDTTEIIDA